MQVVPHSALVLVLLLPNALRARSIRDDATAAGPATPPVSEEDVEFAEGRLLTSKHARRERNPKLRAALLESRRKAGAMECDGCGWHARGIKTELAEAGFEAHHLIPLAIAGESKTRVRDSALLCATCHRLVHRWIAKTGEWLGLDRIKAVVSRGSTAAD